MGQVISEFEKTIQGPEEANRKSKEQLDFLKKAAESKLELYRNSIDEMFLNPASADKVQVTGKRAIAYESRYQINVENTPEKTTKAITEAIGTFSPNNNSNNAKAVEGFKSLVSASLNFILGNVSIGEQEDIKYYDVFFQNNTLVRVDLRIWRYNFSSSNIVNNVQNAFCYIFCKSIINHKELTPDELVYFLSSQVGDDPESVKAYADKLLDVYNSVAKLDEKAKL